MTKKFLSKLQLLNLSQILQTAKMSHFKISLLLGKNAHRTLNIFNIKLNLSRPQTLKRSSTPVMAASQYQRMAITMFKAQANQLLLTNQNDWPLEMFPRNRQSVMILIPHVLMLIVHQPNETCQCLFYLFRVSKIWTSLITIQTTPKFSLSILVLTRVLLTSCSKMLLILKLQIKSTMFSVITLLFQTQG
ncbi:Hypothetical_protein [Hexamita inflata]|uniref:Hypothetical_protein n=1 Tax=Hexamita inflata TaxID=28002 RepID=A0AA86P5J1_9EUKA|nr:Hypothetical protein HINF_LOCUS19663 [Hexamita inflata]